MVFVDTAGPNIIARTPQPGSTDATTSATVTATFDEPVSGGLVMELRDQGGIVVAGSVAYNSSTRTGTFTPSAALRGGETYTATVSGARDALGNAMSTPVSWSFATGVTGVVSLFAANSVPATLAANDSGAVELGMKFRATVAGSITGVRFYKGAANTGTHVGRLYTAAGVLLGQVTFTGETASGWQTANFSAPVPITPNTTYIVSYHAPVGRYSVNGAFFNPGDVVNGPLVGRGNYNNDRNGTYRYGPGGTAPTSSFNGSNYWVDVVFRPN